ncbi:hypothetical protein GCM10010411_73970 [Actinomadura fulvescens]|uniref:Secreted protein n=1 Tax=Actinomadura fulvescens TaxID=46160 RepID=A0ABN3QGZ1_9ACTN
MRSARSATAVALTVPLMFSGVVAAVPATANPVQASAPAAVSAAPSARPVPQAKAQARWRNVWYGKRNAKTISSPNFTARSKTLQITARCWNGGDGTYAVGVIYQKALPGWSPRRKYMGLCLGKWMRFRITNARVGKKHYASVRLGGLKHTTEVFVQSYH